MTNKELIEKYEELIKALSDQVALVSGDAFMDQEGYGYKALALSQKITKLESEIQSLKQAGEVTDSDIEKWAKETKFLSIEKLSDELKPLYGDDSKVNKITYDFIKDAITMGRIDGAKAALSGKIKHT